MHLAWSILTLSENADNLKGDSGIWLVAGQDLPVTSSLVLTLGQWRFLNIQVKKWGFFSGPDSYGITQERKLFIHC